jgi:hypothetical protein
MPRVGRLTDSDSSRVQLREDMVYIHLNKLHITYAAPSEPEEPRADLGLARLDGPGGCARAEVRPVARGTPWERCVSNRAYALSGEGAYRARPPVSSTWPARDGRCM